MKNLVKMYLIILTLIENAKPALNSCLRLSNGQYIAIIGYARNLNEVFLLNLWFN